MHDCIGAGDRGEMQRRIVSKNSPSPGDLGQFWLLLAGRRTGVRMCIHTPVGYAGSLCAYICT